MTLRSVERLRPYGDEEYELAPMGEARCCAGAGLPRRARAPRARFAAADELGLKVALSCP